MKDISNRHKYVAITLINAVITFLLLGCILVVQEMDLGDGWVKFSAWVAVVIGGIQIISLLKTKKTIFSFEIWFVVLAYLFMFGQIILVGIFRVDTLYALGYERSVLDSRYHPEIMFQSSLFILMCIQCIVMGFLLVPRDELVNDFKYHSKSYHAAIVFLTIGFPCHLLNSASMIYYAQKYGSYGAITESTGLIDDFSNFLVYGLLCLLVSNRLSKKKMIVVYGITCIYLVLVMMLTGDRRYQVVSIIVLLLAFLRYYKVQFSRKFLWIVLIGYLFLNVFFVLREIRTDGLVSIDGFFSVYFDMLLMHENNILVQTLYEFGGSFYTVCLALKYIPGVVEYVGGFTLLSGIIAVVPLGFLYKESALFQKGRVATHLMEAGKTTVGGSLFQDLYANFGFLGGVILATIFGVVVSKLFNKGRKDGDEAYGFARYYILFYALIHLVRASFTEVIRTAVWALIVLYLVYNVTVSSPKES